MDAFHRNFLGFIVFLGFQRKIMLTAKISSLSLDYFVGIGCLLILIVLCWRKLR